MSKATPARLIEPWAERKAHRAPADFNVNALEARAIDAAYAAWLASPDGFDGKGPRWRAYKSARHAYCISLQISLDQYEERAEAAADAMRRFRDPNRKARKAYTRRMVEEAQERLTALNSTDDATGREVVEAWYALQRAKIDHALACRPINPRRTRH